jgi:hypothetical protein
LGDYRRKRCVAAYLDNARTLDRPLDGDTLADGVLDRHQHLWILKVFRSQKSGDFGFDLMDCLAGCGYAPDQWKNDIPCCVNLSVAVEILDLKDGDLQHIARQYAIVGRGDG